MPKIMYTEANLQMPSACLLVDKDLNSVPNKVGTVIFCSLHRGEGFDCQQGDIQYKIDSKNCGS